MKYGVSTACFYPQIIEEAVMELSENGIVNIEVFINTFCELEKGFVKNLSEMIKNNGQNVVSVHPFTCGFEPFMLFTEYDRRFNDAMEFHKQYFEVMNTLGAKIFVFHGDRRQSTLENKQYYERFALLRDLGKQYGITVAQENVEHCKSASLDFLEDMITYLDGDVSIVFDNKQALRSGVTYQDFINKLGKKIVHVHISDNNNVCDCLPIGHGELDMNDLLSRLDSVSFEGCVIVELYRQMLKSKQNIIESFNRLTTFNKL